MGDISRVTNRGAYTALCFVNPCYTADGTACTTADLRASNLRAALTNLKCRHSAAGDFTARQPSQAGCIWQSQVLYAPIVTLASGAVVWSVLWAFRSYVWTS